MTAFIPLRSNPAAFTELIHQLGVKDEIVFEEIPSLVDPEASPRPVLAVVAMIFLGDEEGIVDLVQYPFGEESTCHDGQYYYSEPDDDSDCDTDYDPVVSFRQYITTTCSMYAAVHSVLNSCPSRLFKPGLGLRTVSGFFCTPKGRARTIRKEVAEEAYAAAVAKDLEDWPLPPEGAHSDDPAAYEARYHFVCFARSDKDGCLYVMDGWSTPLALKLGEVAVGEGGDIFGADTVALIKSYIDRKSFLGHEEDYRLLALVDRGVSLRENSQQTTNNNQQTSSCPKCSQVVF